MSDDTTPADAFDIQQCLAERYRALQDRDRAQAVIDDCNSDLIGFLGDLEEPSDRYQHTDGTIVRMVSPRPRRTIVAEKLMEVVPGITVAMIEKATNVGGVRPYVMVDYAIDLEGETNVRIGESKGAGSDSKGPAGETVREQ